jgi:hypothetical protein
VLHNISEFNNVLKIRIISLNLEFSCPDYFHPSWVPNDTNGGRMLEYIFAFLPIVSLVAVAEEFCKDNREAQCYSHFRLRLKIALLALFEIDLL